MKKTSLLALLATAIVLLSAVMPATAADADTPRGCRQRLRHHVATTRLRGTNHLPTTPDHYKGDRRQLVVLAAFADIAFKEEQPLELWQRIFNEEDLQQQPFCGSVRDYFLDQSYGQFRLTFDLHHITLSAGHAKYGSTRYDDENSQFLVYDIVDSLEKKGIDWSPYDWNGDGYVDQLLIVYAGKGSSYGGFGGDASSIWPHQWWLSEHIDPTTGKPSATRTVTTGDNAYVIDSYCAVQELYSNGSYGNFGTICHEYTHCFGIPDFYGSSSILGDWDLMDRGNYAGEGFCPIAYSAHERMIMGWLTPQELTAPTEVSDMPALADEPVAYLVRNDAADSEYYVIENRQRKKWDTYLPGSGITVFHINYDRQIWEGTGEMPNTLQHKRYYIIPANNQYTSILSTEWAYPYAGNDSLTNHSTPASVLLHANTDGTQRMSKPIYNMAVGTDGRASFLFMQKTSSLEPVPNSGDATADKDRRAVETLYRIGPVSIVRCADGSVRKQL